MAIKPEGGWDKALMARPLREILVFAAYTLPLSSGRSIGDSRDRGNSS